MAEPLVTIIVPVHNGGTRLDALLDGLTQQDLAAPYEVIVVDDASTDDTAEQVRRRGFRLLRTKRRSGSYAARNLAVGEARGTILAFTDADCTPTPAWLAAGVAALERGADLVAGHIEVPLGPRPTVAALVDRLRFLDQQRYVGTGFAATANLLVRKALVEDLGAFNDRLRSGGDLEFGLRARAAGGSIVYAPDAVVIHDSRDTMNALVRKAFRIGRGTAAYPRVGRGPIREQPQLVTNVRSYLPRRRIPGWERLDALRLSRRRKALVFVAEYLGIQLPRALGAAFGTLRDRSAPDVRRPV
jgi:glycosyltransferase involved in cell wall biosynthesis